MLRTRFRTRARFFGGGGGSSNNWLYDFASTTNFWPYAVAVDSEDNIIAVGRSSEDTAGGTDACVFKISSSGNLIWSINYGDAGENQLFRAVTVDSSNNIYVSGQTNNSLTNSKAFWMKLNPDGDIQIEKTAFDGSGGYERSYDIAVDGSGYIYLFADIEANNGAYIFPFVVLYDSSGTKLSSYHQDGDFYQAAKTTTQRITGSVNSDGSIISVSSRNQSQGYFNLGAWTRSGTTFSRKNTPLSGPISTNLSQTADFTPYAMSKIDSANNIYYYIPSYAPGANDIGAIYKRDSSGNAIAQAAFGGFNQFGATTFFIDQNDSPIIGLFYGVVAELDTSLNLLNSIQIDSSTGNRCVPTGISRLSNGNVVVVGRDYDTGEGFITSIPIDGSGNGTYGNWTVASYSTPTYTPYNLGSSFFNGNPRSDSVQETDPNYTKTDATITYTKY
jgi:hypothetical protein